MHVAVVGGGISGLTAALRLRELGGPDLRITVLDGAPRLGGKLDTGTVGGVRVEQGAETFLLRNPAVALLAERVGLAELVHPAPLAAGIVTGGRSAPVPRGTLMGIPADPPADAPDGAGDGPLLAPGADISVGALVRAAYGPDVLDRLVDPLLGGVYAGRADDLSLAVTMPALHAAAQRQTSLAAAVRVARAAAPPAAGPVFGAVPGGMSALVAAVAAASGATLRNGNTVRELARDGSGWRLTVGETRAAEHLAADAVVLAVPSRPAGRLLSTVAPGAAQEIGALDYASVALVTLVLPGQPLPESSGFLVPAGEGFAIKAATFVTRKWPHLARPDRSAVRLSIGRYRETRVLQRPDAQLAELARAELGTILGTPLPEPLAVAVRRWGGGLPQYAPGHLDRITRARAELAGLRTVALAGAAYDGVGVPACVDSGRAAAEALADVVVPQGGSR